MATNATELEALAGGDVAAALDAAEPHANLIEHDADSHLLVVAHRNDRQIRHVDLEKYLPAPARQRGTVRALTAAGFVAAFNQRTDAPSPAAVYADIDHTRLVAVINDDTAQLAGWRDHRITYQPEHTPEWLHWVKGQGLGTQEAFAQVIENGETEIRNPSATVMLELAQTFNASSSAKFKLQGRLRDGRTQLVYEEEIEATAGEGLVEIPETFTIEVRPFYGAEPVTVDCRLRYRLTRGDLQIGYRIHRPEEIVRESFIEDVVGYVASELSGYPLIDAVPAEPIAGGR